MHDNRRRLVPFTIDNGDTTLDAAEAIDTMGRTLCGIVCPASIGSAATMTFNVSGGDVTGTTQDDIEPAFPSADADFQAAQDADGTAASITVTLTASKTKIFTPDQLAKARLFPRWIQPEVNADPGADLTFYAILSEI